MISRRKIGSHIPDLSCFIELADFDDVDIREIVEGKRKNEKMNRVYL